MRPRAWTAVLCLVALAASYAPAPAQQPKRDWKSHPAIVKVHTDADVFAVGDVHGDYERLVRLLVAGKIIAGVPDSPQRVQWAAGKSWLVCTGDMIDKWDRSLDVIALFRALRNSAKSAGGGVIVTMGNHEAAFLADPFNRKAKTFLKDLKRHNIDPQAVAAGRDAHGIGAFLHSLPLAARVNDWFFAHAGFTRGRTLEQLDKELRDDIDAHGYDVDLLPSLNGLLEARLYDSHWWDQKGEPPAAGHKRLVGFVRAVGAKHLVIGHQPAKVTFADQSVRNRGEVYHHHDGLLFLIDVGMSRGVDPSGQGFSEGALLRISGGQNPAATAVFPDKAARLLWPQRPK